MTEDLKKAYHELNLNDKRNEFNSDLCFLQYLCNELAADTNCTERVTGRNYDSNQDQNMTEEEFLELNYEQIFTMAALGSVRIIFVISSFAVKDFPAPDTPRIKELPLSK